MGLKKENRRGLRCVRTPSGTFGDFFPETSFLETDFGFFDFGGQAASFEPLLCFFDSGLRAVHIDIFGLFGDLGHDGHFVRSHLGVPPEDSHVVRLVADAIAQFADA